MAFKKYETGVFFTELLKRFSEEKYEEGRKQEYLVRKQESDEDIREYYSDKMRSWIQAYAPDKRSIVEFKDEILMGLFNAELKETCLFFMPKELKHINQGSAGPPAIP